MKSPIFVVIKPYARTKWELALYLWRERHLDTAEIARRTGIPEPVLYRSLAAAAERRGERMRGAA